jgi:hypothetical protein
MPATITPHHADIYEPGAILEYSWGYDQTNIDYFMVLKRKDNPNGVTWLTLVPMTVGSREETLWMQGKCSPGHVKEGAKPFRRKLHKDNGREFGVAINSYGWCGLWDGKASHWTAYA